MLRRVTLHAATHRRSQITRISQRRVASVRSYLNVLAFQDYKQNHLRS